MSDRQRVVGWAVLVASVLALLVSAVTGFQSYRHAQCQSAVNEALIQATNQRAAAAAQDRDSDRRESQATADLIRTVFTTRTSEERLAAYASYRDTLDAVAKARAEAEASRQAHPLPAPPSESC